MADIKMEDDRERSPAARENGDNKGEYKREDRPSDNRPPPPTGRSAHAQPSESNVVCYLSLSLSFPLQNNVLIDGYKNSLESLV